MLRLKRLNKKKDIIQALTDILYHNPCTFSVQWFRKHKDVCKRCALNHCVYNLGLLKDRFGGHGKNRFIIRDIIAEVKKITTVQQYQTPYKARIMLIQIINRINLKNKNR